MPLFLIERNFAEQLELDRDAVAAVMQVNADVDIQWLFSFLSVDKKKTYCLYEAPNAAAIREAAKRLNVPADAIVWLPLHVSIFPRALRTERTQNRTATPYCWRACNSSSLIALTLPITPRGLST